MDVSIIIKYSIAYKNTNWLMGMSFRLKGYLPS
jgi:hypothetical protein